jgi:isopentenyldiphosphate isomerase
MINEIKISDNGKYIIVQVKENMTRTLAERLGLEAVQLGNTKNITRFLYDLRDSRNTETINANYIFANQDMKRIEPNPENMIAMLTSPNDKSHDFIETVLRNAGYTVKLFIDEAEAIAWLEEASNIL